MKKSALILFLSVFVLMNVNYAQDDSTKTEKEKKHKRGWNFDFNNDWDDEWDINFWDWYAYSNPFIEFTYGIGEPKQKKFASDFSKIGLAEIKLGYTTVDTYIEEYLLEVDEGYVFISNLSTKLNSNASKNELDSELWRFGIGNKSGYGYSLGFISLVPYSQDAMVWSRLKMNDYPGPEFENDIQILDRYNESIRFGTVTEGGVNLKIGSSFSLNAGYEAATIFPRHMFWKHLGSAVIEGIATGALNNFIDDILEESPAAGPIIYALLKNGISFAFYSLRRDEMNWPFATETPLTYETFKFGLTFTF